jgi:leader peptidase (prepilin peptidase)/N-methyltransferase
MSPLAATCFLIAFAAVFGGAIGSFLNVVVYRLPNGISLSTPPSHCPKCKTPIRWYDNVPVFGWLKLGGRCRACRCWIPIRYPAVEAFTAAMFAALVAVERPLEAGHPYHAILLCVIHVILLCTLLCAALIDVDGNRPPLRLFIPALLVGAMCSPFLFMTGMITGVTAALLGFGVSIFWGILAWLLFRRSLAPALGLACIGLFLGWQVVAAIALVTFLVHPALLLGPCAKLRWLEPPCMLLLIFTLVWIFVHASLVLLY